MPDESRPPASVPLGDSTAETPADRSADPRPSGDNIDDLLSPELAAELANEQCDVCGSSDTWWRNCKLLCRSCGGIVKSCADL